jgi:type I restriction enzyme M protein
MSSYPWLNDALGWEVRILTGDLRNQIDGIWNDFWSGGLSNPLQVIEQITYLIFIKRLDEMQELEERKATTLGEPVERRIFPDGKDERGEPYANLRWSRFKHFADPEMYRIVDEHVFPFILHSMGRARHMRATCATSASKFPDRPCSPRSSIRSTEPNTPR